MKTLTSLFAAGALAFGLASCHSTNSDKGQAVVNEAQGTIDSLKMEVTKQRIVDSMQEVAKAEKETAPKTAATSPRTRTRTIYRDRPTSNYTSTSSNNAAYDPTPTPVTPAKRGWSAKAKGAVIGAGAGALGGAILDKNNRGAGALIGGLGGAAVGTGVGAILDHKNGR